MFTYEVYKAGNTFAGINIAGRIRSKQAKIRGLLDPTIDTSNITIAELNALEKFDFERWGLVYSDQDIAKEDFLYWRWVPAQNLFVEISQADRDAIDNFEAQAQQMWNDRYDRISQMRNEIVACTDWSTLSKQHKQLIISQVFGSEKAIAHRSPEVFWEALGLGDEGYIGDYNYSPSIWDRIRNLFR